MEQVVELLPWIGAGLGLVVAILLQRKVMAAPAGTDRMQELATAIQEGAKAFLVTEYKLLTIFVVIVAAGLFLLGEDKGGGDEGGCPGGAVGSTGVAV